MSDSDSESDFLVVKQPPNIAKTKESAENTEKTEKKPRNPRGGMIRIDSNDTYKKLSRTDTVRFIERVEQEPAIWDISHADYKDVAKTNAGWILVEKDMPFIYHTKGYGAKRVWASLMADFRAEERRQQKPSGSGGSPIEPSFFFYENLDFMRRLGKSRCPTDTQKFGNLSDVRRDETYDSTPSRKRGRRSDEREKDREEETIDKLLMTFLKKATKDSPESHKPSTSSYSGEHADILAKVRETLDRVPFSKQLELKVKLSNTCDDFLKNMEKSASIASSFDYYNLDNFPNF